MKRTIWLGLLAAGCSGGAATSGTAGPTTAGGSILVTAPSIPHGTFDVAAGELADPGIYLRLKHRVRLAREGVAYLKLGGPRVDDTGQASKLDTRPIYPVLGESPDAVRVVAEEDHARLALWIQRSDTAETTVAAVQVADPSGHAPAIAGLWLGAGASMDVDARAGAAGFREVTLRSQWLTATGYVAAAALGSVWLAGERESYEPTTADDDSKPPVATGSTVAASTVRAAPAGDAAVIAEIKKPVPVRVVKTTGAWTEIEIHVPRVRVRGFVPTSAISPGDQGEYGGFGFGNGFGMTDTETIAVPAGACLYDAVKGEVAGVNLAPAVRFVFGGERAPGWWPVVVLSPWGRVSTYVHDTAAAKDPKGAVLESCAAPASH